MDAISTLETTETAELDRTIVTGAAVDESLDTGEGSLPNEALQNREGWRVAINDTLIEWGKDPGALKDDDFVPPTVSIITLAAESAMDLRDNGGLPPTSICPDGDGGLSFELATANSRLVLHFDRDGSVELIQFGDEGLIQRQMLRTPRDA